MRKGSITFFFLLLLLFSLVIPSWAQKTNKDVAPILEQLKKAQDALQDFTADINQVKVSSLSKTPVVSLPHRNGLEQGRPPDLFPG